MVLPVTGSPLHDWSMMTATMAATTTAPAMLRVRSRENTCRISVTLNQLHVTTLSALSIAASEVFVPTGWS